MGKKYSDDLQNPLWQRRRLEIFNRDNWTCTLCLDDRSMLAVHHLAYNGKPWQVNGNLLKTVCCHCHDAIHSLPHQKILEVKKGVSFHLGCKELVCFTDKGVVFIYSFYKDENIPEIISIQAYKIAA